jgi:hypothetical protein
MNLEPCRYLPFRRLLKRAVVATRRELNLTFAIFFANCAIALPLFSDECRSPSKKISGNHGNA